MYNFQINVQYHCARFSPIIALATSTSAYLGGLVGEQTYQYSPLSPATVKLCLRTQSS